MAKKSMSTATALDVLRKASVSPSRDQLKRKKEVDEAFRVFLANNPTEAQFSSFMNNVIQTSRILYIMMRKKWN